MKMNKPADYTINDILGVIQGIQLQYGFKKNDTARDALIEAFKAGMQYTHAVHLETFEDLRNGER